VGGDVESDSGDALGAYYEATPPRPPDCRPRRPRSRPSRARLWVALMTSTQWHSGAISEAIRGHQRPSEAIRGHHRPSGVIRGHQRANQSSLPSQSRALEGGHRHPIRVESTELSHCNHNLFILAITISTYLHSQSLIAVTISSALWSVVFAIPSVSASLSRSMRPTSCSIAIVRRISSEMTASSATRGCAFRLGSSVPRELGSEVTERSSRGNQRDSPAISAARDGGARPAQHEEEPARGLQREACDALHALALAQPRARARDDPDATKSSLTLL
jgi:hypothetical protein